MPTLSVVIPVYNEEGSLPLLLRSWREVLQKIPGSTMLVVDDGSKDRSGAILDEEALHYAGMRVLHHDNCGHGPTLLKAYRWALDQGAEWIFQIDSDDQIPAEEFWLLWERRHESPFVLGARFERHDPLYRKILSRVHQGMLFVLFSVWIRDPNIPFRLMRRDCLASFLPRIPSFTFAPNVLLSVLAKLSKLPTLDIPVRHKERESGSSFIHLRSLARIGLRVFCQTFSFRRAIG